VIEFRIFQFLLEKTLYSPNIERPALLSLLIKSRPRSRFLSNKVDAEWIISNVDDIGSDSLKFFLGKKNDIEISQLNQAGDIVEKPEEDIPHAIVYLHLPTGVGAIELNSEVAATSLAISKRLQILLASSGVVQDLAITIKVNPLRVSTDFTSRISDAFRLVMIQANYGKPNPPDALRRVQQPVQSFLSELNGDTAKVKFTGENLEKEPALDLATTAMRTSNIVSAKIQDTPDSPLETINSIEQDIAKLNIENDILLREDGDEEVIRRMLMLREEAVPLRGENADSRAATQQLGGDI